MDKLNLEKIFCCTGCGFIVDDPSESQCCGYLYCQSCVSEINYAQCTICKTYSLRFRKSLFAKNLLHKIELKCRYECGAKYTYEDMRIHLLNCNNKSYKCTINYCTFEGKRKELDNHMIEKHPLYILIMMENYDDFKTAIDKIANVPIQICDIKKPDLIDHIEDEFPYFNFNVRNLFRRSNLQEFAGDLSHEIDYNDSNSNRNNSDYMYNI
jgi:hypothetical protein